MPALSLTVQNRPWAGRIGLFSQPQRQQYSTDMFSCSIVLAHVDKYKSMAKGVLSLFNVLNYVNYIQCWRYTCNKCRIIRYDVRHDVWHDYGHHANLRDGRMMGIVGERYQKLINT